MVSLSSVGSGNPSSQTLQTVLGLLNKVSLALIKSAPTMHFGPVPCPPRHIEKLYISSMQHFVLFYLFIYFVVIIFFSSSVIYTLLTLCEWRSLCMSVSLYMWVDLSFCLCERRCVSVHMIGWEWLSWFMMNEHELVHPQYVILSDWFYFCDFSCFFNLGRDEVGCCMSPYYLVVCYLSV